MSEEMMVVDPSEPKLPIAVKDGRMQPANHAEVWRLATILVKSGMVPQGLNTPEKMFLAMSKALMLGLDWTQVPDCMMVVNNRPSIWGDVPKGLVLKSGLCADFVETLDENTKTATCTVTRWARDPEGKPYRMQAHTKTYSIEDAKLAGLWGKAGPWTTAPKRMLQLRARAFALRDVFPDVLGGMPIAEEMFGVEDESRAAPLVRTVVNEAAPLSLPEPVAAPRVDPFVKDAKPEPVVVPDPKPTTKPADDDFVASLGNVDMGGKQTIGTNATRRGKAPAI